MLLFKRLTKRFKCSSLLRFAVIMFSVKELMIYLASSLPALYAAEALQAFSFALFVPAYGGGRRPGSTARKTARRPWRSSANARYSSCLTG